MALDSCTSCVKYLLFAFNFIFWLVGAVIIGLGIWIKLDVSAIPGLEFFYKFDSAIWTLIAVGSLITLIGFLGCCGAIRESQCMLATFFVFLFLLFGALLAAGIMAVMKKNELRDQLTKKLDEAVSKLKDKDPETKAEWKHRIGALQNGTHCCGVAKGEEDYETAHVPPEDRPYCDPKYRSVGCVGNAFEKLEKFFPVIAGVAIGVAIVLIMGMIFSMCLCCAIRQSGYE